MLFGVVSIGTFGSNNALQCIAMEYSKATVTIYPPDLVYIPVKLAQYGLVLLQRSIQTGIAPREDTETYWVISTGRIQENIHLIEVIENGCIVTQVGICGEI